MVPQSAVTAMTACIHWLLGHASDVETQLDLESLLVTWLSLQSDCPILANAARRIVSETLARPSVAAPATLIRVLSTECDVLEAVFPPSCCESSQTFVARATAVFCGFDGGDTVAKFPSIVLLLRTCTRVLDLLVECQVDESVFVIDRAQQRLKCVVSRLVLVLLSGRFLAGVTGLMTTHVKESDSLSTPLPPVHDPVSIAAAIAPLYPILMSLIVDKSSVLSSLFDVTIVTSSPLLPGQLLTFGDEAVGGELARQACVFGLLEASSSVGVILQASYCQPENLMRYSLLYPTSPSILPCLHTVSEVVSLLESVTLASGRFPCSASSLTNIALSLMPVVFSSESASDLGACLQLAIRLCKIAAAGRSLLQDASPFGGCAHVKVLQFLWYFRRDIQTRMMNDLGWEVEVADSCVIPVLAALVVVRGVVATSGSRPDQALTPDDPPQPIEPAKLHALWRFLPAKWQHTVGPSTFFAKVCTSLDPAKVPLSLSASSLCEALDPSTLRWMLSCISNACLTGTEPEESEVGVPVDGVPTVLVLTAWCAVLLRVALSRGVSIVAAISFASTVNLLASQCPVDDVGTVLATSITQGLVVCGNTPPVEHASPLEYVSAVCGEILRTYAIPSVSVIRELVEGVFWHRNREVRAQSAAAMLRVCCGLPLDGRAKMFVAEQDACVVYSARQACSVLRSALETSVVDGNVIDSAAFRSVIAVVTVLSNDNGEAFAGNRLVSRSSATLALLKRIGPVWCKLAVSTLVTFAAVITAQCELVLAAHSVDVLVDTLQVTQFVVFVDALPAVCRRCVAAISGAKSGLSRSLSKLVQTSALLDQVAALCQVSPRRCKHVLFCGMMVGWRTQEPSSRELFHSLAVKMQSTPPVPVEESSAVTTPKPEPVTERVGKPAEKQRRSGRGGKRPRESAPAWMQKRHRRSRHEVIDAWLEEGASDDDCDNYADLEDFIVTADDEVV
jgi:hypothetical protein